MMKKITIISTISIILLVFTAFFLTEIVDKSAKVKANEPDIYGNIIAIGDLRVAYNSYEELVIDSDIVAFGEVKNVTSFMEDERINSTFDFVINSVEKGGVNENDVIPVQFVGGTILYKDYLIGNKEYYESTMPGFMDKEIELYGDKYVESFFYEVPNIKEGDQLVLFLSPTGDGDYYIVGTQRYGKCYYDKARGEIYRVLLDSSQKAKNNSDKREMLMSIKSFKEMVKETKYISKTEININKNMQNKE